MGVTIGCSVAILAILAQAWECFPHNIVSSMEERDRDRLRWLALGRRPPAATGADVAPHDAAAHQASSAVRDIALRAPAERPKLNFGRGTPQAAMHARDVHAAREAKKGEAAAKAEAKRTRAAAQAMAISARPGTLASLRKVLGKIRESPPLRALRLMIVACKASVSLPSDASGL